MSGIVLGLAAAALISLTNVFSRLHFEAGSNPVTFLLLRYAIVVAVLLAVLAAIGRLPRIEPRQRRDFAIAGTLNIVGAGSLAFAIERLEVSLAVLVLYLFPFFTLLFSCVSRRARPPVTMLVALAVAFGGLTLALGTRSGGAPPDPIGLAFALAAAIGIAASFTWIERTLGEVGDVARLLGLTVVGLLCAIVLAAFRGGIVWPLPAPDGWSTLLIATTTFGAASAAMFVAVARIGATPTAMLMNLEPPLTALLAVLLIGDALAPRQLLGIGIVVAAVLAVQLAGRRARSPQ